MPNLFTKIIEILSRKTTLAWKKAKRVFKNKQPDDLFLKTVKLFSMPANDYIEAKMKLDTGCDVHNLITLQAVHKLRMSDQIIIHQEAICTCLNGQSLISMGTLLLRWKGKRFRKIFITLFHVIDSDSLPWDVILGAETIQEHGILRFAGFGGSSLILPKRTKEEKAQITAWKQERNKIAIANDAKVDADIRAKEEAARQNTHSAIGSGSQDQTKVRLSSPSDHST